MSEVRRPESIPPAVMPNIDYKAHPLADDFPMIEGEKFEELVADIKANGIIVPIALWDDGGGMKIIDGRNRHRAAKVAGHTFTAKDFVIKTFASQEKAEEFVNSVNNKRRHMSSADIHAYITKVMSRYSGASDRDIARITGHSHSTVGKVRDKLSNPLGVDKRMMEDFEEFKKKFGQKWPDTLRVAFVKRFENDIRQMLGL
jgi:ParB/RepB/Spo0J family partition protein